ncbi:MAG: hypothetical protein IKU53_01200 [Firmicutes bacterium]|nr:hypothetical protein [Bacillota bacterium]
MNIIEEMNYDLNFNEPRIIIKDDICIIENVKSIVMIGETSVTVESSKKYVTVNSADYVIKEIIGGRLLIEGQIQGVEIIHTSSKDNHRRVQNK